MADAVCELVLTLRMNIDDKNMFTDGLCGVVGGDDGGVYQY